MVKEGNVRLDISIDAELVRKLRSTLHAKGMDKKGGISDAVTQALQQWIDEEKEA